MGTNVWAGDSFYIFGGMTNCALSCNEGLLSTSTSTEVVRFDPESESVTLLPDPLPIGVINAASIWTGAYAYIFVGASCGPGNIIRFDPVTGVSSLLAATFPAVMAESSVVWTGSLVYLLGGSYSECGDLVSCALSPSQCLADQEGWPSKQIAVFNPTTEAVTVLPTTLPVGKSAAPAIWDGSAAYLFGGVQAATPLPDVMFGSENSPSIERFDPATMTMSIMDGVSIAAGGYSGFNTAIWDGEAVYIFSDYRVERYDPTTNTLSMAGHLPEQSHWSSVGFNGCAAYVFGTVANTPSDPLDERETDHIVRYGPASCSTPSAPATSSGAEASPCYALDGCPRTPARPGHNFHFSEPSDRDSDGDGIDDFADNCPAVKNHDQLDADRDGIGNACDDLLFVDSATASAPQISPSLSDQDRDGIPDIADNCPATPNHDQADMDRDYIGDACDDDADGDGVADRAIVPGAFLDNCPLTPNADQADADSDGAGDACRPVVAMTPSHPGQSPASSSAFVPDPDGPAWAILAFLGLLFAVIIGLWRYWVAVPLLILFSRLKPSAILNHAGRQRLLDIIDGSPGIHFEALVRASGMSRSVTRYHLDVLTRTGLVRPQRTGKYLSLHAGAAAVPDPPVQNILRSVSAHRLLEAVAQTPGQTVAHLAGIAGLAKSSAGYHLRRFVAAGLVEKAGPSRKSALTLTEAGWAALGEPAQAPATTLNRTAPSPTP